MADLAPMRRVEYAEKALPSMPSRAEDGATSPPTSSPASVVTTKACSPRSPIRPFTTPKTPAKLTLRSSNGCTALPSPDLKKRICDSRLEGLITITQVPIDNRIPLPPTPTTPFTFTMGNKPSAISNSPTPDDESHEGSVRRTARQPPSRKTSLGNVFKRIDSRSPLPRDVTASVMSVFHRDVHARSDSTNVKEEDLPTAPSDAFIDQADCHGYDNPSGSQVHSISTMTMTESRAGAPLSASTTIRDHKPNEHSSVTSAHSSLDLKNLPPLQPAETGTPPGLATMSPTLPAPSPLPEDSPHKYGLRDKIDTPEVPKEPPNELTVAKMRRKSSGLEIFNEAKNLQSAQSFLNGLSTARRRAESQNGVRPLDDSEAIYTTTSDNSSRPSSTKPGSTPALTSYQDSKGRKKGHNFKSTGFAYARPLTIGQIKCYRNHQRLLPSRNRLAPVECAVCHIDDDGDHFNCSWCAVRMCMYCRRDFAERGLSALRERIRKAELGGADDSAMSSSMESLPALGMTQTTGST